MSDNTYLDLDTESIIGRIGVRSSLTDINQVSVFTDKFEEKMGQVSMEGQQKQQMLDETIFLEDVMAVVDTSIIDRLFVSDIGELIIRNEKENTTDHMFPVVAGMLIMAVLLVLSIRSLFGTKGKQRNDVNHKFET